MNKINILSQSINQSDNRLRWANHSIIQSYS